MKPSARRRTASSRRRPARQSATKLSPPAPNNASPPGKLYRQVESLIRQTIARDSLKPGDRLPTETEMCRQYGVSRSTLRHALHLLETDGWITRTRGRGTFLRDPKAPSSRSLSTPAASPVNPSTHHTIGLVFCATSDTDVLQMGILLGAENAAKSHGYSITFARSGEDEHAEAEAIARMARREVNGVIVMPVSNHSTTAGVRHLIERRIPFVLVDRYLTDVDAAHVVSDNAYGFYRLTEHLIILGYRAFRVVNTTQAQLGTTSVRDRYSGFCQALNDYGLGHLIRPPLTIDPADNANVRQHLAHLTALRSPSNRPMALLAIHDEIAIALMSVAGTMGLKPPDDFALVGFDDLPNVSRLPVPLTTVTQQRMEMGFKAAHLLIDKIEGRTVLNDKIVLPVTLMVRESCGAHQLIRALG
jgi:DNA-binding LacI/PurR family transcriptional regulator